MDSGFPFHYLRLSDLEIYTSREKQNKILPVEYGEEYCKW